MRLIDTDKIKQNLDLATLLYIDRVNNSPCGETIIQLFKGADSTDLRNQCKTPSGLSEGQYVWPASFQASWALCLFWWSDRDLEEISGMWSSCAVPVSTGVLLQSNCLHPVCCSGGGISLQWFTNGPPATSIPLPVPDPAYPWGASNCENCKGFCAGHYLMPNKTINTAHPSSEPPSSLLKKFYAGLIKRPVI